MKPIGPYVAVHELPIPPPALAAAGSPIQTLRATDRLTGIPVLLHVLTHAQSLPEVPFSPHLLPVVDSGVDGEQAYLVTELPLHASPARDALLAARGALAALAALHEEGMAHGGVSAAQLWDLGAVVAVAGAGLPWRRDATPQADLDDLVVTLQELGPLPQALRPLLDRPGSLRAREALALIGGAAAPQEPAEPPLGGLPPSLHDGTPIVLGQPSSPDGAPLERGEGPTVPSGVPAAGPASPPPADTGANTGQPETPQERRKRQNEERREQARADTQAAAVRRAARLNAQQEEEAREAARAQAQAALGVPVPEPFQMGFAEEPLRDPAAASGSRVRQVERLPASLRRPSEGQASGAVSRLPAADPATGSGTAGGARRNLPPIRIGWDEDDSWRVVRSAPAPRPGLPRWLWPLLAVAALLMAAAAWTASRPKEAVTPVVAAPCCTVAFALRGVAGVSAQLRVDTAPQEAKLSEGEVLGNAPGNIRFPVAGRYRLRVTAEGYRPATLEVTVPRPTPVNIDLGN